MITPKLLPAAIHTSILQLQDGRILEWLECGDPAGYPLVFFHGFLGSARQALISDAIANQNGVRIIAASRPGVGSSSPYRHATMKGHAQDVLQLLAHLGITDFATLGVSNGAGFALACSAIAPSCARFAIVCSPLGPLHLQPFFQELALLRRVIFNAARYTEFFASIVATVALGVLKRHPPLMFYLLSAVHKEPPDARLAETRATLRAILSDSILDATMQPKSAKNLIHELALSFHWGISPTKVVQPMYLWQGTEDKIISMRAAKALAALFPHVSFYEETGDHTLILSVLPNIMESVHAMRENSADLQDVHVVSIENQDIPPKLPVWELAH